MAARGGMQASAQHFQGSAPPVPASDAAPPHLQLKSTQIPPSLQSENLQGREGKRAQQRAARAARGVWQPHPRGRRSGDR